MGGEAVLLPSPTRFTGRATLASAPPGGRCLALAVDSPVLLRDAVMFVAAARRTVAAAPIKLRPTQYGGQKVRASPLSSLIDRF
eukprot:3624887-Pleurochrysis_carterae.AAC.7